MVPAGRSFAARVSLALLLLIALALPRAAAAAIHSAQVLAGPSNEIIEVAGAAMAPDGSGGIVYLARSGGVVHVFAVPFENGAWGAPEEVDGEDRYGASQPAIAAGEGGRLLVVWVQRRNVNSQGVTLYELQSASRDPGSNTFGEAITVDPDVGEPYTGDASHVEPRLAMAPGGQAYVVYRAVTDDCGSDDTMNPRESECPPGHDAEFLEVRAAHFEYLLWKALGAINRAPQVPMRPPTPANAPAIGIGVEGNGVVAWQEPENASQPARIWVRRLFGSVPGTVLSASPETLAGRPVSSDAEAPAVSVGRYGEARVAYRIQGAPGSPVPTTQLFANTLPSTFNLHGGQLEAPVALPGAVATGIGAPAGALDPRGNFRLAWSQGGAVRLLSGGEQSIGAPVTIGHSSGGPVLSTINPAGGGTTVWQASAGGSSVVETREDYAHGAYQSAVLAGDLPGPVSGLALGGSGQGDALLGWLQGAPGDAEVVGDFVQAPPASFLVNVPKGWVHAARVGVEWQAATDAVAGVSYAVYVDGRRVASGLPGTQLELPTAQLGDGVHAVQVLATDGTGQSTMSPRVELKIAIDVPAVRVRPIDDGRGVRVAVTDATAGVDARATRIAFGDGARASGHADAEHRYRHAGVYTLVAYVRDNVGNGATVHIRVRVR
ncbi:MAG TPA: PKD domain-containing protein [Solirubrobacteraceae bacterium]|nr:PKD domain-containing protein [Solirubrobacteraceae bacterium]